MTTTETATIRDDRVTRTLMEILDEYGADHVYKRHNGLCEYYVDGKPSCLVGHVIARLTPSLKGIDGSVALNYAAFRRVGYSDKACAALQIAQGMQDDDVPWGAAVKAACIAIWNDIKWEPETGDR